MGIKGKPTEGGANTNQESPLAPEEVAKILLDYASAAAKPLDRMGLRRSGGPDSSFDSPPIPRVIIFTVTNY